MVYIITSKTKSRHFKPHYNNAMGKYYHTKSDYLGDMKKQGLEPYNPGSIKSKVQGNKPYTPSEWAKKMTKIGCDQVRENGKTSGAFNAEMTKYLKTKVPDKIVKQTKGGIYAE